MDLNLVMSRLLMTVLLYIYNDNSYFVDMASDMSHSTI